MPKKMNKRILRKIWICFDVWMDIFPHFDRPQLGLKLALLSPRFNVLIDKYFDGKRELTIWKWIGIDKMGTMPKLSVFTNYPTNYVPFPLPDRPLHNKIRFHFLLIGYIDHSVIAFLRANQHIWDKGTNLRMSMPYSFTANEQQPMGSLVTSFGKRRSVRVQKKTNKRRNLRKIWICFDVWMDIFPFFDRPQLGLKLALLSPRFSVLIDKYFDGKRELTIWKWIKLDKMRTKPVELSVITNYTNFVPFPVPDHSLHSKIRFNFLRIEYIDHSVLAFLRANQHIWDRGTNLDLHVWSFNNDNNVQPLWDVLAREIWPIFAPNIRRLGFLDGAHLDNLLHRTSPTILTDLNQLNSIDSIELLPDAIGVWPNLLLPNTIGNFDDGPNATPNAGQALSKWLHTPSKDGKPKQLFSSSYFESLTEKWINNFKEAFLRATTSSSSHILSLFVSESAQIVPFELVNERTREKLTLEKRGDYTYWLLKRCPIGQMIQLEDENSDNWNNVGIYLSEDQKCIGPLSPQKEEKAAEKGVELCRSELL